MGNYKKIISPRIQNLCDELKINREDSLNKFWSEIIKNGGPIIEKSEKNSEDYLVTIVWRECEPTDKVAVIVEAFGFDTEQTQLEKLQGTELWYRTWELNGSTKSLYMFVINERYEEEWADLDLRIDPLNPNKYECVEDEKNKGKYYILSKEQSYVYLSNYKEKDWTIEKDNIPKGKIELIEDFESYYNLR